MAVVPTCSRWTIDGTVVLGLYGGEPQLITGAGATVWAMLVRGPRGPIELVEELAEEFGMAPAVIAPQVGRLLSDLAERGLIRPSPSEGS